MRIIDFSDGFTSESAPTVTPITRASLATGTAYRILANDSSGVMSENAALTANRPVISDANGQLSTEATLAVSRGGTGLASGTSGGLLYYSGTGTLASSGAYTAGRVLYGNGAGNAPTSSSAFSYASSVLTVTGVGASSPGTAVIKIQDSAGLSATPYSGIEFNSASSGNAGRCSIMQKVRSGGNEAGLSLFTGGTVLTEALFISGQDQSATFSGSVSAVSTIALNSANTSTAGVVVTGSASNGTGAMLSLTNSATGGTTFWHASTDNGWGVGGSRFLLGSGSISSSNAKLTITSSGDATFNGDIAFTSTSTQGIVGTTTNDSAATGNVGQYTESVISSPASAPTSTQWGDLTSISLTAGDWDVTAIATCILNGGTATVRPQVGISTTSGNSATGLIDGSNWVWAPASPASTANASAAVPSYRMSLSATTTVYLKVQFGYSAGTPQFQGRLSARRVR